MLAQLLIIAGLAVVRSSGAFPELPPSLRAPARALRSVTCDDTAASIGPKIGGVRVADSADRVRIRWQARASEWAPPSEPYRVTVGEYLNVWFDDAGRVRSVEFVRAEQLAPSSACDPEECHGDTITLLDCRRPSFLRAAAAKVGIVRER